MKRILALTATALIPLALTACKDEAPIAATESQQTAEPVKEAPAVKPEAVVNAAITSADKGETWQVTATISNPEPWLERIILEIVEPVEGPAPKPSTVVLEPQQNEMGGIEFVGEVAFDGDPTGFVYTWLPAQDGRGTRTATTQVGTKTSLL